MKTIEFAKEMKILAISYDKDFTEETITFWYQHFKDINKDVLHSAIKKIITTQKFMPSIAELLEKCKKEQKNNKLLILQEMKNNNYFKNGREYEKAINWIEKDITPVWLLEDMKRYYTNALLINKNMKMLEE